MALNEIQKAILAMVVEGKTNGQIAEELSYSISNIKYHLDNIYKMYHISRKEPSTMRALLVKEVTKIELSKYM